MQCESDDDRRRDSGRADLRDEWGRIVASLIRMFGDWDLAEECAQEAFAQALRSWRRSGVPDSPGAWVTTVARNRARDRLRRRANERVKLEQAARLPHGPSEPAEDDERRDRRPAAADVHLLPPGAFPRGACGAHAALPRRRHDGRDRASLPRQRTDHGEATRAGQAQDRRSRHSLSRAAAPPARRAHHGRPRRALPAVQRGLCGRGRGLHSRRPLHRGDPAHAAARRAAARRHGGTGTPGAGAAPAFTPRRAPRRRTGLLPLEEQNRVLWDSDEIEEAVTLLEEHAGRRTRRLPTSCRRPSPRATQRLPRPRTTDWPAIASLYGQLATARPVADRRPEQGDRVCDG